MRKRGQPAAFLSAIRRRAARVIVSFCRRGFPAVLVPCRLTDRLFNESFFESYVPVKYLFARIYCIGKEGLLSDEKIPKSTHFTKV